jgi:D-alanine-D-alanine ligase
MEKLNILLIFGGKSAEHEISIESAKNIYKNIDLNRYNLFLQWIDKKGSPFYVENTTTLDYESLNNTTNKQPSTLININNKVYFYNLTNNAIISELDIAFPLIHGPTGEDGVIQGFLSILYLPYVGSSVLPSAICMDKVITKKLISQTSIRTAKYISLGTYEREHIHTNKIIEKLRLPLFVKPASLGSSIGITKVKSDNELQEAINYAFHFDKKIIIEESIIGREIECAVLGNFADNIIVSQPGEIITKGDFYSYEAKYSDGNATELVIPAKIDPNVAEQIKNIALLAYKTLQCEDYARVDMFLDKSNNIYLNEINTIPGFTKHSMYPMLMTLEGFSLPSLIDKLIHIALKRSKH